MFQDGTKQLVTRQVSSGAIRNKEWRLREYAAIKAALNFTDEYGKYTYKHYDWTKECNFAILQTDTRGNGLHYTVELVTASVTETRDSNDQDWNHTTVATCCIIL